MLIEIMNIDNDDSFVFGAIEVILKEGEVYTSMRSLYKHFLKEIIESQNSLCWNGPLKVI